MVGVAHDLAYCEEDLPDRRVKDREIAALDRGSTSRRVRAQPLTIDVAVERLLARAANEQPVFRYSRSITPAMAMPKPTHIVAIP